MNFQTRTTSRKIRGIINMNKCQNCGEHISSDFVRVFGVNGEVESCVFCGPAEGHSNRLRLVNRFHGSN